MLYYTILDAICCLLFLNEFELDNMEDPIPLPENFHDLSDNAKVEWINDVCKSLLEKWFFDNSDDIMQGLRNIVQDSYHPENYWTSQIMADGRVQCHFCEKTYAFIGSLKSHEKKEHNFILSSSKGKDEGTKDQDHLQNYILLLFKLTLLHRNLDTAVDMGDGVRSVKSANYELPIYNKTNKTKYSIGSIHLICLTEGLLDDESKERLITNRFINLQGGKNNNIALDEYVELLNRDSKAACTGFQTKESILAHSKEFPHLVNSVHHYDALCAVPGRKGFHKLPSYVEDVKKVVKDLVDINALTTVAGHTLKCKSLSTNKNPYDECYRGLTTMIHRHKPLEPFHRLRNKRI